MTDTEERPSGSFGSSPCCIDPETAKKMILQLKAQLGEEQFRIVVGQINALTTGTTSSSGAQVTENASSVGPVSVLNTGPVSETVHAGERPSHINGSALQPVPLQETSLVPEITSEPETAPAREIRSSPRKRLTSGTTAPIAFPPPMCLSNDNNVDLPKSSQNGEEEAVDAVETDPRGFNTEEYECCEGSGKTCCGHETLEKRRKHSEEKKKRTRRRESPEEGDDDRNQVLKIVIRRVFGRKEYSVNYVNKRSSPLGEPSKKHKADIHPSTEDAAEQETSDQGIENRISKRNVKKRLSTIKVLSLPDDDNSPNTSPRVENVSPQESSTEKDAKENRPPAPSAILPHTIVLPTRTSGIFQNREEEEQTKGEKSDEKGSVADGKRKAHAEPKKSDSSRPESKLELSGSKEDIHPGLKSNKYVISYLPKAWANILNTTDEAANTNIEALYKQTRKTDSSLMGKLGLELREPAIVEKTDPFKDFSAGQETTLVVSHFEDLSATNSQQHSPANQSTGSLNQRTSTDTRSAPRFPAHPPNLCDKRLHLRKMEDELQKSRISNTSEPMDKVSPVFPICTHGRGDDGPSKESGNVKGNWNNSARSGLNHLSDRAYKVPAAPAAPAASPTSTQVSGSKPSQTKSLWNASYSDPFFRCVPNGGYYDQDHVDTTEILNFEPDDDDEDEGVSLYVDRNDKYMQIIERYPEEFVDSLENRKQNNFETGMRQEDDNDEDDCNSVGCPYSDRINDFEEELRVDGARTCSPTGQDFVREEEEDEEEDSYRVDDRHYDAGMLEDGNDKTTVKLNEGQTAHAEGKVNFVETENTPNSSHERVSNVDSLEYRRQNNTETGVVHEDEDDFSIVEKANSGWIIDTDEELEACKEGARMLSTTKQDFVQEEGEEDQDQEDCSPMDAGFMDDAKDETMGKPNEGQTPLADKTREGQENNVETVNAPSSPRERVSDVNFSENRGQKDIETDVGHGDNNDENDCSGVVSFNSGWIMDTDEELEIRVRTACTRSHTGQDFEEEDDDGGEQEEEDQEKEYQEESFWINDHQYEAEMTEDGKDETTVKQNEQQTARAEAKVNVVETENTPNLSHEKTADVDSSEYVRQSNNEMGVGHDDEDDFSIIEVENSDWIIDTDEELETREEGARMPSTTKQDFVQEEEEENQDQEDCSPMDAGFMDDGKDETMGKPSEGQTPLAGKMREGQENYVETENAPSSPHERVSDVDFSENSRQNNIETDVGHGDDNDENDGCSVVSSNSGWFIDTDEELEVRVGGACTRSPTGQNFEEEEEGGGGEEEEQDQEEEYQEESFWMDDHQYNSEIVEDGKDETPEKQNEDQTALAEGQVKVEETRITSNPSHESVSDLDSSEYRRQNNIETGVGHEDENDFSIVEIANSGWIIDTDEELEAREEGARMFPTTKHDFVQEKEEDQDQEACSPMDAGFMDDGKDKMMGKPNEGQTPLANKTREGQENYVETGNAPSLLHERVSDVDFSENNRQNNIETDVGYEDDDENDCSSVVSSNSGWIIDTDEELEVRVGGARTRSPTGQDFEMVEDGKDRTTGKQHEQQTALADRLRGLVNVPETGNTPNSSHAKFSDMEPVQPYVDFGGKRKRVHRDSLVKPRYGSPRKRIRFLSPAKTSEPPQSSPIRRSARVRNILNRKFELQASVHVPRPDLANHLQTDECPDNANIELSKGIDSVQRPNVVGGSTVKRVRRRTVRRPYRPKRINRGKNPSHRLRFLLPKPPSHQSGRYFDMDPQSNAYALQLGLLPIFFGSSTKADKYIFWWKWKHLILEDKKAKDSSSWSQASTTIATSSTTDNASTTTIATSSTTDKASTIATLSTTDKASTTTIETSSTTDKASTIATLSTTDKASTTTIETSSTTDKTSTTIIATSSTTDKASTIATSTTTDKASTTAIATSSTTDKASTTTSTTDKASTTIATSSTTDKALTTTIIATSSTTDEASTIATLSTTDKASTSIIALSSTTIIATSTTDKAPTIATSSTTDIAPTTAISTSSTTDEASTIATSPTTDKASTIATSSTTDKASGAIPNFSDKWKYSRYAYVLWKTTMMASNVNFGCIDQSIMTSEVQKRFIDSIHCDNYLYRYMYKAGKLTTEYLTQNRNRFLAGILNSLAKVVGNYKVQSIHNIVVGLGNHIFGKSYSDYTTFKLRFLNPSDLDDYFVHSDNIFLVVALDKHTQEPHIIRFKLNNIFLNTLSYIIRHRFNVVVPLSKVEKILEMQHQPGRIIKTKFKCARSSEKGNDARRLSLLLGSVVYVSPERILFSPIVQFFSTRKKQLDRCNCAKLRKIIDTYGFI